MLKPWRAARSTSQGRPNDRESAHLTGQLSDDICMGCHQIGDARVLKPGKTIRIFALASRSIARLHFSEPPTRENPPQDDHWSTTMR
jgi:hypothetical protein